MKSLGLEGKVGAPAIVRTNPLLRKYDQKFAPGCWNVASDELLNADRLVVESFLPFTWFDALDVVRERYVGAIDRTLTTFLKACALTLPDRVFTYDLDTPELDVSLELIGRAVTIVLSGSCRVFVCPRYAFITGDARDVWTNRCTIITGRAEKELWIADGCCTFATVRPVTPPFFLGGSGNLLAKNADRYLITGPWRSLCFDGDPLLRALYDCAIGIDPHSPTLDTEMEYLSKEYRRVRCTTPRPGGGR